MEKTMDNESHKLISIVQILLLLISLSCISLMRACRSSFWYVFQFLFYLILCMWETKTGSAGAKVAGNERCSEYSNVNKLAVDNKKTVSSEVIQRKCSDNNANDHANAGDEALTIEEVKTVMGNLGTSYDPHSDELQGKLSSNDIIALFEEQEPSADEVEEVFSIFDENNDGFIHAKELRKVLLKLCFTEVSEEDCKRMIRAFDDNGDGLIDFDEFLRLLTRSLSC